MSSVKVSELFIKHATLIIWRLNIGTAYELVSHIERSSGLCEMVFIKYKENVSYDGSMMANYVFDADQLLIFHPFNVVCLIKR